MFNTAKHETVRHVKARICYIELEDSTNETENVELQSVKDWPKMIGDGVDGHTKLQREWRVRDCRLW